MTDVTPEFSPNTTPGKKAPEYSRQEISNQGAGSAMAKKP